MPVPISRHDVPAVSQTIHFVALAALSLLFLHGCGPAGQEDAKTAGAPASPASTESSFIPVGEYGSLTGTTAAFGQSQHKGIVLAIEEINAAGGVLGKPFRLFSEDNQSKQEETPIVVAKLINQNHIVALLGEVASSRTLAAAPLAQRAGIPMISTSSTNPKVTLVGNFIFRMCYLDTFQGAAIARFVKTTLGKTRAAVLIDVRNDYSVGLGGFFSENFTKLGGTIVSSESYSEGDQDFRAQLTKIKATNPEVLVIPGYYADAAKIAKQARDLGFDVPLVGGDGWESSKLFEIGGTAVEGSYYSNHYFMGDAKPEIVAFVKKFQERWGEPPDSMSALAYDGARLLADAMRRAGTTNGDAVRQALASTKDWPGVTGAMSFDENRNPVKPIVILGVQGGKLVLKETMAP